MLFSKRVRRWIEDTVDANFSGKPDVLHAACRDVDIEDIKSESLVRLLAAIWSAVAQPNGSIPLP